MSDTNMLTKLTLKGMGCDPSICKTKDKDGRVGPVALAQMYGAASGLVTKLDTAGNVITGITGDFEGVNLVDGTVYRSGIIYLPGGFHEMLASALPDKGKADEPVKFAIEISSRPASNPIGYEYTARKLIDIESTDPLSEIRAQVSAVSVPLLSAPTQEGEHAEKGHKEKTTKG